MVSIGMALQAAEPHCDGPVKGLEIPLDGVQVAGTRTFKLAELHLQHACVIVQTRIGTAVGKMRLADSCGVGLPSGIVQQLDGLDHLVGVAAR